MPQELEIPAELWMVEFLDEPDEHAPYYAAPDDTEVGAARLVYFDQFAAEEYAELCRQDGLTCRAVRVK